MSEEIYAEVFGGQYPVCTEDQKKRLEEAYKSAMDHLGPDHATEWACSCELLIQLLAPETPRVAAIMAGVALSKEFYMRKLAQSAWDTLTDRALQAMPVKGGVN